MSQFNKLFDDKPALRKQILEQRLAMPRKLWETKSRQIGQNLKFWLQTKPFTRFILYRHFRQEPNLNSLAYELGLERCYYPRVHGESLHMYPAPLSDAGFQVSRWGLEEPYAQVESQFFPDAKTLILMPALAIDEQGYRLGYGAGFFDRYLQNSPAATLGICFDSFLLTSLPHEDHDIPLQAVITEFRRLEFSHARP